MADVYQLHSSSSVKLLLPPIITTAEVSLSQVLELFTDEQAALMSSLCLSNVCAKENFERTSLEHISTSV